MWSSLENASRLGRSATEQALATKMSETLKAWAERRGMSDRTKLFAEALDSENQLRDMAAQFKGLLKWVAENVCEINTLEDDPGKCVVEIIAWIDDDHDREVFKGHGRTIWDAFIRALNNARDFAAHLQAKQKRKRR